MNVIAIIPTLNPSLRILGIIDGLLVSGITCVIIVNDGSNPEKGHIFDQIKNRNRCVILEHEVNQGKGSALKTAFRYVIENYDNEDGVITLDDDGQHQLSDVLACVAALKQNNDGVVLGCRDFKAKETPLKNKLGNKITNIVFRVVYGIRVGDTQTGLRAIPVKYLPLFVSVEGDRFEYESNMLIETKKQGIPFYQVPIQTIYLDENKASHFNPIMDSWRIYKQMILFLLSSVLSFSVDISIFWILSRTLAIQSTVTLVFFATIGARIVSSLFNFTMNRLVVFKRNDLFGKSIFRYYFLCVFQALVSFGLVSLCALFLSDRTLVFWKVIIDFSLFIVSYRIQNKWVFKTKQSFKQEPKKKSFFKSLLKSVAVFTTSIFFILVLFFGALSIISYGPSPAARDLFVLTVMQTSAAKFLARMQFSEDEIKQIIKSNTARDTDETTNVDEIKLPTVNEDFDLKKISIEDVSGKMFNGKMMIVNDPSRVYIDFIDKYGVDLKGKCLPDFVKESNAIAGVNGGAFSDPNGFGKGGFPVGVVIQDGKVTVDIPSGYPTIIGFDFKNKLIVGKMTAKEAIDRGMKDAVSFGPALIINGNRVPVTGNGGGLNPRTAIGQKADGSILLLVIDGRQPGSLGASYADLVDVMEKYGAINAANLDGGASSLLIYDGQIRNSAASLNGPRGIPNAILVRK